MSRYNVAYLCGVGRSEDEEEDGTGMGGVRMGGGWDGDGRSEDGVGMGGVRMGWGQVECKITWQCLLMFTC